MSGASAGHFAGGNLEEYVALVSGYVGKER